MRTNYQSDITEQDVVKFRHWIDSYRGHLSWTYPRVTLEGSQDNENQLVVEELRKAGVLMAHVPLMKYVDIGAGEPKQCSNTWEWYKLGARGLLIEPLKAFHNGLLRHRPGDYLWPTAAGDTQGWADLRCNGTVSSLDPDWQIEVQNTQPVEIMKTQDILDLFPGISECAFLCSIDVEGYEKQVLQGIDVKKFRPDYYLIEYVDYGTNEDTSWKWQGILTQWGYKEVGKTSLNKIFKR